MSKLRYPLPQPVDQNPAPSSRRLAGFGTAAAALVIAGLVWPIPAHNPVQVERQSRILTPPPAAVVAPRPVRPLGVKAFDYAQIEFGSRRIEGAGDVVQPVQLGVLVAVSAHDPMQFELQGRIVKPAAFTAPVIQIPRTYRAVADYDPITVFLESRVFAGAGEPTQYPALFAQRAIEAHHPTQRELFSRRIVGAGAPLVLPPVRAFRPDPIPERVARDLESRRIQGAGEPPAPQVQFGVLVAVPAHDPVQLELSSRRIVGAGQAPPPAPPVRAFRPDPIPERVARALESRRIQGAGEPLADLVQRGVIGATLAHDPVQRELLSRRFVGAPAALTPAIYPKRALQAHSRTQVILESRLALVGRVDLFGPPAGRPPYGVILQAPIGASVPAEIFAELAAHELTAPGDMAVGHLPGYDGVYFHDAVILYGDYALGVQPAHGVILGGNLGVTLT